MPVLTLGDRSIEYLIVKRRGNRNLRMSLRDDGVLRVSMPPHCTRAHAETFIREKSAWIARAAERHDRARAQRPVWKDGAHLRLLDREITLQIVRVPGRRAGASLHGDALRLDLPAGIPDEETFIRDLVLAWYRRAAAGWLPQRAREWGDIMGVTPSAVRVRQQRSRWGSCSAHGVLNLNILLLMLPRELAEYVIVHELAHLVHHDHSPRFWDVVARHLPDFRALVRRMRAHHGLLRI
jgi:predicted metal-dependent hydrolase